MQDQWFGDEGDFVKFCLLRRICGITANGDPLPLGVVWYLRNAKRTDYLAPGQPYEAEDPDLFQSLREWVRDERSRGVSLIENSFLFPTDTVWFSDLVPARGRDKWLKSALAAVEGCRVVFLDPDTGLQPEKGTGNHVLLNELTKFCEAASEPTVVVYQHRRHKDLKEQVQEQTAQIKKWSRRDRVVAVWHSQFNDRLFYVLPSEADREIVLRRIEASCWKQETVRET